MISKFYGTFEGSDAVTITRRRPLDAVTRPR